MDWMNWSNFAYLMVLICTIGISIAGVKYKIIVSELKDVAVTYRDATKDGSGLDEREREKLAKECMDVVMSLVRLVWKVK